MYADYEEFYNGIANVQFLYSERSGEDEVNRILTEDWNYLALEERKLDEDLDLEED